MSVENNKHTSRNLIFFLLITVSTILLSLHFYKKNAADPIVMQILNGCGDAGVAARFADRLQRFNIARVDNAERFDIQLTRLEYHRKRVRKSLPPLQDVLNLPEGRLFFSQDDTLRYNVTLIIGKDYQHILAGMHIPDSLREQHSLPE